MQPTKYISQKLHDTFYLADIFTLAMDVSITRILLSRISSLSTTYHKYQMAI